MLFYFRLSTMIESYKNICYAHYKKLNIRDVKPLSHPRNIVYTDIILYRLTFALVKTVFGVHKYING